MKKDGNKKIKINMTVKDALTIMDILDDAVTEGGLDMRGTYCASLLYMQLDEKTERED